MNRYKVYCILLSMVTYLGMSQEYDTRLVQDIIVREQLDSTKINYQLLVSKKLPYNDSITIVVIPINQNTNFNRLYNAYIYSVNNSSKKIINKLFEKDFINFNYTYINGISIDTGLYILNENTRAFGIQTHSESWSYPSFEKKNLKLYTPHEDTFINILSTNTFFYDFSSINDNTNNESYYEKSVIIVSNVKTNNYYDINIKTTHFTPYIKQNVIYIDKFIKSSTKIKVLKYNGTTYQ